MIRGLSSRSFSPSEPDSGRGIDLYLLLSAGLLLFIGLASLYSIDYSQGTRWFAKQSVFAIVGVVPLLLMWKMPAEIWRRLSWPLYIVNALLLLAVLLLGVSAGGAQRWIDVGPFQFQPSELSKIALALTLAAFYSNRAESIKKLSTFLLSIAHVSVPILLVFVQPHLGGTLTLLGIWLAVTVIAGVPWRFIGSSLLCIVMLGVVAWNVPGVLTAEQKSRPIGFLNPDPQGDGYQQSQALIAMGSGGPFGKGYLKGDMKAKGSVPEQQTDFVFSVIGEEGGLFGSALVLSAFGFFFYRSWLAAFKAGDPFKRMVGAGLLAALGLHFFANIGMNLTVLPVVGLWLPFMSYGGTALWLCMASLGFFAGCK